MKDFLVWVFSYKRGSGDCLTKTSKAIIGQTAILQMARENLIEWQKLALESQRSTRNLAIAFRAHCDAPDVDIREDLDELVRDLADSVAVLEERLTF